MNKTESFDERKKIRARLREIRDLQDGKAISPFLIYTGTTLVHLWWSVQNTHLPVTRDVIPMLV